MAFLLLLQGFLFAPGPAAAARATDPPRPAGTLTATDGTHEDRTALQWSGLTSPASLVVKRTPTALRFSGSGDRATVSGIALDGSFTIEFVAWHQSGNYTAEDMLLGQGVGATNQGLHIGFRDNDTFTFAFHGNDLNTPVAYPDADWHHWAVSYDRATGARAIYRDGTLVASDVATGAYAGSGTLEIGNATLIAAVAAFEGEIDLVRIWDVVRTPEDLRRDRYARLAGTEAGLVAAWDFDELDRTSPTLLDKTGNHPATLDSGTERSYLGYVSDPLPGSTTSYDDPTGDLGRTYLYCVMEEDASGNVLQQACDLGGRALAAPGNVQARDGDDELLTWVTWADRSATESGFVLFRDGTYLGTVAADAWSFSDDSGALGQTYDYCVATYQDADGNGTFDLGVDLLSEQVCNDGFRMLEGPTEVAASDGTMPLAVHVTWADHAATESGFVLFRDDALHADVGADVTSYDDTGAAYGQTYSYCVQAYVDVDGGGSYTAGTDLLSSYPNCDDGYRTRPTLTATDGTGAATQLQWSSFGTDVARMRIARAPSTLTFGDADHVTVPDVDLSGSFTIEVRARHTASGDTFDMLVGQGSARDAQGLHVGFRDDDTFTFDFFNWPLTTEATYTDQAWHHWAVTYDRAAGTRSIYLDGVLVATHTGAVAYSGSGPLQLGDADFIGATAGFRGALDFVRVWDHVRTPAALRFDRHRPLAGTEAGLVGLWTFDEGDRGDAVRDRSDAGHDGTLSGALRPAPTRLTDPDLTGGEAAYTDATGAFGQGYVYCAEAFDAAGSAITSACDAGHRALVRPGSVSAADGTSPLQTEVTWTDDATQEDGYVLFRDSTFLAAVAAGTTTYSDTAGTPGQTYAYCVAAYEDTDGNGRYTEASDAFSVPACDAGTRRTVLPAADVAATDAVYGDRRT